MAKKVKLPTHAPAKEQSLTGRQATKEESLQLVLKTLQTTPEELVALLPDHVVAKAKVERWERHLNNRAVTLQKRDKALTAREEQSQIAALEFEVKLKSLRVQNKELDQKVFSQNEIEKAIARELMQKIKRVIIPSEVNSGDQQALQKYLLDKFYEAEALLGLIPTGAMMPADEVKKDKKSL